MSSVISVEGVSKSYRLGMIGGATLKEDASRWWAKMRGRQLQLGKLGEKHHDRQEGDEFWALRDINFQVGQGEVVGIVGRNGAGKSTLLKILSQVTAPTSGEIKIKGRIASLLEVGTGFHPELSGKENVFLNGAILGMTREEIKRKFDEIVAFSGIEQFIDTPVKRYSSGMYVRLAFAVAAHLESEILVLDEVLAVGDAEFQKKCMGKMQDVSKREGRTVLFVSHNMSAIERLCQRGLLLAEGEITCDASASETVERCLRSLVNTDAAKSLQLSSNRSGTGDVRLRSFALRNNEGAVVAEVEAGDDIELVFECENTTSNSLDDISFGYSISTPRGEVVAIHYSDYEEVFFQAGPGRFYVSVKIDRLPLAPGEYLIGVRILRKGNEVDWPMDFAAALRVKARAQNGHYSTLHSGVGSFLLQNQWKLNPAGS